MVCLLLRALLSFTESLLNAQFFIFLILFLSWQFSTLSHYSHMLKVATRSREGGCQSVNWFGTTLHMCAGLSGEKACLQKDGHPQVPRRLDSHQYKGKKASSKQETQLSNVETQLSNLGNGAQMVAISGGVKSLQKFRNKWWQQTGKEINAIAALKQAHQ